MIVLKNVSKVFKNGDEVLYANRDINLEITKGLVALVGKSGSGKTTLLNLIGGLLKPSEGQIIIDKENITNYTEKEVSFFRNQKLGFVFQSFYLEDSYTVYENVELPLIIAKVESEERKEKVMKMLKIIDMVNKADVLAINLSGGEKQRVAIARAIINNPKILLCDEPTGNLDATNGKIIIEYLKRLADEGIIVILVTHNMEYANLADRIIEISDGIVV